MRALLLVPSLVVGLLPASPAFAATIDLFHSPQDDGESRSDSIGVGAAPGTSVDLNLWLDPSAAPGGGTIGVAAHLPLDPESFAAYESEPIHAEVHRDFRYSDGVLRLFVTSLLELGQFEPMRIGTLRLTLPAHGRGLSLDVRLGEAIAGAPRYESFLFTDFVVAVGCAPGTCESSVPETRPLGLLLLAAFGLALRSAGLSRATG